MSTQPEENDALWQLLGKSKAPGLPANFSARVLASVSTLEGGLQESRTTHRRFSSLATLAAIAAAIAVALVPLMRSQPGTPTSDEEIILSAISSRELSPSDLPLLVKLDEVIDAELTALWIDTP